MKRLLSLILCVLIMFSYFAILTSCGEKTDEIQTDDDGFDFLRFRKKGKAEASEEDEDLSEEDTETSDSVSENAFKIGLICLHDKKTAYDLNFIKAMENMQAALRLSEVIIKLNIPEGIECYETAKDLVGQGCKAIIADSFGHEDFMIRAAEEFPDVQFFHVSGTKAHTVMLPNYHNVYASIYEGRYLAGVAAGLKINEMIANGKVRPGNAKIGYVGAYTYAEVISDYTAFFLGARSVCPSVTMEVYFTGSWYDTDLEEFAAINLINNGCCLISQHSDSPGAPSVCEEYGIPNISYNGSTKDIAPNTYIVSPMINWEPCFEYIVEAVRNNDDIDYDWVGNIETGSVILSEINSSVAAQGTEQMLARTMDLLKNGTLHVFDTSRFTVGGFKLYSYIADVNSDYNFTPDTEVVIDGYVHECEFRSAPYFDIQIDGIVLLNQKY